MDRGWCTRGESQNHRQNHRSWLLTSSSLFQLTKGAYTTLLAVLGFASGVSAEESLLPPVATMPWHRLFWSNRTLPSSLRCHPSDFLYICCIWIIILSTSKHKRSTFIAEGSHGNSSPFRRCRNFEPFVLVPISVALYSISPTWSNESLGVSGSSGISGSCSATAFHSPFCACEKTHSHCPPLSPELNPSPITDSFYVSPLNQQLLKFLTLFLCWPLLSCAGCSQSAFMTQNCNFNVNFYTAVSMQPGTSARDCLHFCILFVWQQVWPAYTTTCLIRNL